MTFWRQQLACPTEPATSPEQLVVAKRPLTCCLCSSRWRLAWVCRHVLSHRLSVCVTSLRHPLASFRVCAMRHLTRDGFIADSLTPAVMHTLVRCLQFADSAESQFRGESTELLLATTALLGSIFQNNRGAVSLFRENEGLTTLLSLLRSRVPQETQHSLSPRESRPRMQSLRSILWVLWECCGDETASCAELAGLEGVSLLLTPFGDARCEILALDALRLTLRQLPLVAQRILPRDILRLLDHLAAPRTAGSRRCRSTRLQSRRLSAKRPADSIGQRRRRAHASGNNRGKARRRGGGEGALQPASRWRFVGRFTQIRRWWSRFCSDKDWCARTRFLRNDIQSCRDSSADNCSTVRFTRGNLCFSIGLSWEFRGSFTQIVAMEAEIRRFLDIAERNSAFLFDETVDAISPIDQTGEDTLRRQPSGEERSPPSGEEPEVDRRVVAHIPTWLGFASGAIRLLAKNGMCEEEVLRRHQPRSVRRVRNEGTSTGDATFL